MRRDILNYRCKSRATVERFPRPNSIFAKDVDLSKLDHETSWPSKKNHSLLRTSRSSRIKCQENVDRRCGSGDRRKVRQPSTLTGHVLISSTSRHVPTAKGSGYYFMVVWMCALNAAHLLDGSSEVGRDFPISSLLAASRSVLRLG